MLNVITLVLFISRMSQNADFLSSLFDDISEASVWSYDGEVCRVFDAASNQQDNNMEANEGMNIVFAMGLVHYRYHAIILIGGTTHIQ